MKPLFASILLFLGLFPTISFAHSERETWVGPHIREGVFWGSLLIFLALLLSWTVDSFITHAPTKRVILAIIWICICGLMLYYGYHFFLH